MSNPIETGIGYAVRFIFKIFFIGVVVGIVVVFAFGFFAGSPEGVLRGVYNVMWRLDNDPELMQGFAAIVFIAALLFVFRGAMRGSGKRRYRGRR